MLRKWHLLGCPVWVPLIEMWLLGAPRIPHGRISKRRAWLLHRWKMHWIKGWELHLVHGWVICLKRRLIIPPTKCCVRTHTLSLWPLPSLCHQVHFFSLLFGWLQCRFYSRQRRTLLGFMVLFTDCTDRYLVQWAFSEWMLFPALRTENRQSRFCFYLFLFYLQSINLWSKWA